MAKQQTISRLDWRERYVVGLHGVFVVIGTCGMGAWWVSMPTGSSIETACVLLMLSPALLVGKALLERAIRG